MAVVLFAFAFQGSRGLWDPDEGRYTHVALNMLQRGDWLVPYLDDAPHFTKPPLTYWAIAASVGTFGRSEWAVRLPNALAFLLTVWSLFAISRWLLPERPWLPPLVYATAPFVYGTATIATTDTMLAAFETLAVLGFVRALHAPATTRARTANVLLMWLGFALAFLTKGPTGLLPLGAIVAFVATCAPGLGLRRLFHPAGLAVFAGAGLSWYLVVVIRTPGLLEYFLVHEVWGRVATSEHHRNSEWFGLVEVYLPVLVLGAMPWMWPALRATWHWLRHRSTPIWRVSVWRTNPAAAFAGLWFGLPLLVFCLARSRLPLYVLPSFAPLSVLLARCIDPASFLLTRRRSALAALIVLLVVGRFVAALLPSELDASAMAAFIRDLPATPQKLMFVDEDPRYGLTFYIDVRLQCVVTEPDDADHVTLDEALGAEGPHTLFVVRRRHQVRFLQRVEQRGATTSQLGQWGDRGFFVLGNGGVPRRRD